MTQTTSKRNRYQEQKEARIQQAMSMLSIDMIGNETFALVPSTSGSDDIYIVDIDESGKVPVAVRCDCSGNKEYGHTCVHMLAVNRLFDYAHEIASMKIFDEPTPMSADEIAAVAEEQNMAKLAEYRKHNAVNAYDVLASTKDTVNNKSFRHEYGSCGHIVKPQHAGQLCGSCLCK